MDGSMKTLAYYSEVVKKSHKMLWTTWKKIKKKKNKQSILLCGHFNLCWVYILDIDYSCGDLLKIM